MWIISEWSVLPQVRGGGGQLEQAQEEEGGALVETGLGDPSHLTSKASEWKFPSAM